MARYTGPKFRLCRREGVNLFGNRKYDVEKRDYPPGQHGQGRRQKLSNYGIQLREKQKVKRVYGVLERQFRRYYEKAAQAGGITGHMLLQLLERRLDNVVYRLRLATTRPQARQIVNHGLILVNGKRADIPSFQIKVGDEITIKKEKMHTYLKENLEANKERALPKWLSFDIKTLKGKVEQIPDREDVQFPINEQYIVELYSK
jgi:small subunit ribosomal protein S4